MCKKKVKYTQGVMCMFHVKKPEYVNKTFRMPADLVKRLEAVAQEKNVSLNNLTVQCCEYALENIDKSELSAKSAICAKT
jgi:hypothetical protein